MANTARIVRGLLLLLLAGFFVCCDEPVGTQTETCSVGPEGAKTAEVGLRMGAGELRLKGASQPALLEGAFRYNRERLRPQVDYRVSGETGVLTVGQRRHSGIMFGRVRNEWDLSLSRAMPLELEVKLGAGRSELDLRGLDLMGVNVDMGVGEMRLDLQGPHAKNFRVKINGGIGSGTILLPADVGVRVRVDGGIGSVSTRHLTKDHRLYTNDAYGKSDVTIDLEIHAGIGSLDLRVEPSERSRF